MNPRFISFDDDDEAFLDAGPADPVVATRRVGRAAIAAILGLLVVMATSVWLVVAFNTRGADDIRVQSGRTGPDRTGKIVALPDKAKYTTSFLVHAELPFVVGVLVCAAGFIWWHASVDAASRAHGDMMETARWKAIGAWFFPGANLVFPIRSLRELSDVNDSPAAGWVAIPWWALGCVATFVNFFLLKAGSHSDVGPHPNESGVAELNHLDSYGAFVGYANLVTALLAAVLVWQLTAAVRARITDG